ncbi:DUF1269 domain-containing protein [Planosporangium flavigriseum]|uniref:DUF1269 domain-containing protein n=1 Tax=Planosporangium flavigriseum TaxID=373681 RepID=A0A8J3LNS8_9ACTN|nr:DUF6325 family protein [Planosporangium flavigriseum]NJC65613.1 DUF1269 domain-containing protein [Planosporangium flavigriseum]GIG74774.1 hypothetical protein Pfl04_31780 [Planosporangium flavigriseum]
MAGIGPLEFLVVAFPGEALPDRVASVLQAVETGGAVRIVDALAVVKDRDGHVRGVEFADVPALAAYDVADPGLIDAADVDEVGQALDAGTAALALLIDHVWASAADAAVRELGGLLVGAVRIPEAYANEARRCQEAPGHPAR